jgi:hypothetical protein
MRRKYRHDEAYREKTIAAVKARYHAGKENRV